MPTPRRKVGVARAGSVLALAAAVSCSESRINVPASPLAERNATELAAEIGQILDSLGPVPKVPGPAMMLNTLQVAKRLVAASERVGILHLKVGTRVDTLLAVAYQPFFTKQACAALPRRTGSSETVCTNSIILLAWRRSARGIRTLWMSMPPGRSSMSPFGDGIADTRVGLIDAASREVLIGGDGGVSAVLQRDGRSCGRIALPSVEFAPSCERAAATVRIKGYLVNESSTISPGPASQVSFELSLIRAPGFYLRF